MTKNFLFDDLRAGNSYDIAMCSGIGKRESQQDFAYCCAGDDTVYAVVCDGMGGLNGGELASRTAVEIAAKAYHCRFQGTGNVISTVQNSNWMADTILSADRAVYALKNDSGCRIGAGSTFVSVWLQGKWLFWSSVGDSRVYLFRGKEAVQATTDLNYYYILDHKRASNQITEEFYWKESASGEALISFCGMGEVSLIDRNTKALTLETGDVILLCSDGLYRTIDLEWMRDILAACSSMAEAAVYIQKIIAEFGPATQDNYTCILIKVIN